MEPRRLVEKILNKVDKKIIFPLYAKTRQKKLKNTNFTVISNNCWGGVLYEYYGLPKQSPTVGAYFYADDYVRFCKNLKMYLDSDLLFIPTINSAHYDDLLRKRQEDVIVGKLRDVEIVFLHYKDKKVVVEKWKRRLSRINWDKIILKFSYQNQCTDDLIREFENIKGYKKIVLVGERITGSQDEIIFKRSNGKITIDETENFSMFLNISKIINDRL